MVFNGDVLGADHLLRCHREKCAGLDRGVIGDDHHLAASDATEAGDGARGRSTAPFLVHFVRRIESQLEELALRVYELGDTLPRRQPALLVL
jgi:hypothetical protein